MFAAFVVEREYTSLRHLPDLFAPGMFLLGQVGLIVLALWVVIAGIRFVLGAGSTVFYGLTGRLARVTEAEIWKPRAFWVLLAVAILGLLLYLFVPSPADGWFLVAAHIAAVLAVSWEFLLDLGSLSWRRIWALARFSILEAIRRKALWSFCIILLIFLFASWFIDPREQKDQWRVYVDLVFFMMTALLLITASVLACFSLPTDIRQQTIHTVVTKPVRRFEIILGRIIGFGLLMTAVLVIVAHLSLLFVVRGIDTQAREETMRARQAIYGQALNFERDGNRSQKGVDVGREWTYRQHIMGGANHKAIWEFRAIPDELADRPWIPIEFNFDIYRTSKGGQQQVPVYAQIEFVNTNRWDETREADYQARVAGQLPDPKTGVKYTDENLAREFGYYRLKQPILVVDYRRLSQRFPGGVLKELGDRPFEIRVRCTTDTPQYLGMARFDLYVLEDEGSFYFNYLKGATGIWFLMVVMVVLGVVFSTHLNAVVGLMLAWVLLFCGLESPWNVRQYISNLAQPPDQVTNPGGGPAEAIYRMFRGAAMVGELEQSTTTDVIKKIDASFQVVFDGLLQVLPHVGQYERTMFVAEGFDIPWADLAANGVLLLVYVLPFLVAGYYLINAREVAA